MKKLLLLFSMFLFSQLVWATCATPNVFSVSAKTSSTATLTWSEVPGGFEYWVRYKRSDDSKWVYMTNVTGTSVVLPGLKSGALYQAQIATECNPSNTDYSSIKSVAFYTESAYECTAPSNFATSSITSSTVNLTWTAIAGSGVEYFVRYKKSSSPDWIYIQNISTNSRILTGLDGGSLYQVQLATECNENNTQTSTATTVNFYTAPNYECVTPSNFKVVSKTSSSVNLSWNSLSGIGVEYVLRYKKTFDSQWTYLRDLKTNTKTISGLNNSMLYQVQLATECNEFNTVTSSYSKINFETSAGYACTVPNNFQITSIGTTTMSLSWSALSGTGVEYLVRYKKSISDSWVYVRNITNTTLTISALDPGYLYQIQLATECNYDNSITSAATQQSGYTNSVYSCSIPNNTYSSNINTNSVQFNWSVNSGAEFSLRVRKAEDSTWTLFSDITMNSFTVSSLDSGQLYLWQVKTECSVDNAVSSEFSVLDSVLTDYGVNCDSYLPISLIVDSVDFKRGYLSWSNSNPFNLYNIRYKESMTSSWTEVVGNAGSSIEIENLKPGTEYYASIQLDCSNEYVDLTSLWSDSIDFDTYTCKPPSGITGTNIGDNNGIVSWTPVTGADGYIIIYGPKVASQKDTLSTTLTNASLSSLYAGTNYRFEIQTVCSTQDSLNSLYSTSLPGARHDFITSGVSPCQTPSNFRATSVENNSITLSWDNNGSDSYYISKRASYETDWSYISTTNPNSLVVGSLNKGTLYRFTIASICYSGKLSSDISGLLNQSTSGSADCSVPKGVAVSNVTATSADVDWDIVEAASSYKLRYKLASGNNWIYQTVPTNFKVLTTLTSSKLYAVQVSSNCFGSVYSGPSPTKAFTTLSGARDASDLLYSDNTVLVFPNPAQNFISLNINEKISKNSSIKIYSSEGSLVKYLDLNKNTKIDVSNLSQGIYHVILTDYTTNEVTKSSFSKID